MLNLTKQQLKYINNDVKTSELFYIIKPNVINLLQNNYKISTIYKFVKMELPDINIKYNTFYKLVKRNIIDMKNKIENITEDETNKDNKNEDETNKDNKNNTVIAVDEDETPIIDNKDKNKGIEFSIPNVDITGEL